MGSCNSKLSKTFGLSILKPYDIGSNIVPIKSKINKVSSRDNLEIMADSVFAYLSVLILYKEISQKLTKYLYIVI